MNLYRKLKLLYLILILITAQKNYSQVDTIWTKQYNNGNGTDVLETTDNSFMLIGNSLSSTGLKSILIKTDSDGNKKWIKEFDLAVYGQFNHMIESEDSNIYVLGNNYGLCNIYKFDLEGNIIWSLSLKNYIGSGEIINASKIIKVRNTGIFLIGTFGDLEPKLWISKISFDGTYKWAKIIPTTVMLDSESLNIIKSYEGFLIVGTEGSGVGILHFLRTDNLGNLIGKNLYKPDGVITQIYKSICYSEHPDSGYVLTGHQDGNLALLRLDNFGNVLWVKAYPRYNTATSINYGNSIINSPKGGWIICGGTGDYENPKSFVIQTDWEGNMVWDKVYENSYGQSIKFAKDNGYIACGTKAQKNIWLLKLDVTPLAIISGDSLWNDSDWNGTASGYLDGSGSFSPNGFSIVKYEWSINDSIIGDQSNIELNLTTGLTEISLKVTDESGVTGMKTIPIQVCSFKLESNGAVTSSVSSIGDSIFFATSTDDQIYCFDKNNNLKWTLLTGGDIQSTTTIGPNNNIYVGSGDTRLYNFNLEGNFLWDKPVGGIVTASPAITKNGNIFVGTSTNRLYSIKSEDGSINWNYLTGGRITSSASISKIGDIYFGSNDKYFYSINSLGELNWKFLTNGEINSSPSIDIFTNIYFGSTDGFLYSLTKSGSTNWIYKTNGAINTSPVLDEYGNCYFGSSDGYFYSLNSSGELLWKYNAHSPINGSPSISLNKDIIFGCDDGKIIALKNDGSLNWYFKTKSSVKAAPLITTDGRIYVGSSDWSIYGFRDPNYINISEGIAYLQWPTFQKDNQRTGSLYDSETSVESNLENSLVNTFKLSQNYPNPFNPITNIKFSIAEVSQVEFYIYSLTGEKIKTISQDIKNPGYYSILWDGSNDKNNQVGSGIYIFQMKAAGKNKTFTKSIKMIKLK